MAHEITVRKDGTAEFFSAKEKAWHVLYLQVNETNYMLKRFK